MQFWFHFICMTWIVKYGTTKSSESVFNIMALGPSALLIYWDPLNFTKPQYFEFNCSVKEGVNYGKVGSSMVSRGQIKILDLLENTTYQIQILPMVTQLIRRDNGSEMMEESAGDSYFVEGTTKMEINSPPAKPDFSIETHTVSLQIIIQWLPCGQTRNCGGLEPGTHFYVTYKALESRNTVRIKVTITDHIFIPYTELAPGKTWEIIVTSVNGNYETNSDPQELFTMPIACPVQSVAVAFANRTNNSSLIISWEPPRQTSETIDVYFICYQPTKPKIMWNEYVWTQLSANSQNCGLSDEKEEFAKSYVLEIKIENVQNTDSTATGGYILQRATNYTFFIIPTSVSPIIQYGFIYEFQYTTP